MTRNHQLEMAAAAAHGALRGLMLSDQFEALTQTQRELVAQKVDDLAEALWPSDARMKAPPLAPTPSQGTVQ